MSCSAQTHRRTRSHTAATRNRDQKDTRASRHTLRGNKALINSWLRLKGNGKATKEQSHVPQDEKVIPKACKLKADVKSLHEISVVAPDADKLAGILPHGYHILRRTAGQQRKAETAA
ncbi:unnamed protein product [Sympodiomycopsis kandeliae]